MAQKTALIIGVTSEDAFYLAECPLENDQVVRDIVRFEDTYGRTPQ